MSEQHEEIDARDGRSSPVFVDATGRRRKRVHRLGYVAATLCGGYSVMLAISLAGGPVGPHTLLPRVAGGDGETKVVVSPKARARTHDGGPMAFPLPLPRHSTPFRTSAGYPAPGTATSVSAPGGSTAPGSAPAGNGAGSTPGESAPSGSGSVPATGNQRVRTRGTAGAPAATPAAPSEPSEPGSAAPAAPPAEPEPPAASPPAPVEPVADDAGTTANGAGTQDTGTAPISTEGSPSAPAAATQQ